MIIIRKISAFLGCIDIIAIRILLVFNMRI